MRKPIKRNQIWQSAEHAGRLPLNPFGAARFHDIPVI